MSENTTPKVSVEVAEAEFDRFAVAMDFDLDESVMGVEDKDAYLGNRRKIVRAIQQGSLVIDDEGCPVYTASSGDVYTFREPTGATLREMDRVSSKQGGDIAKMFKLMGSMTQVGEKPFAMMKQRDLKVCTAIAVFFLA